MKNAKIKLSSKDKILRCFSNKNIKLGQFTYDHKQEYYNVELKIQEDKAIDEWEVSCLFSGESFNNNYKIEAQKDGKPITQPQIGIGEFVLHPSLNFMSNNLIFLSNYNDFSLLYSLQPPRKVNKNISEDLLIWSNYYPAISSSLTHSVTYKEKK